jgi:flagellar protein FlaJ
MNSSVSSPKRGGKSSYKFKEVKPFDLFYQLTYMSALASAGITSRKTFEIAAQSSSSVASYFAAVNTLVEEMRFDYPQACRAIGEKAKSDDVRTFLLRLSDALRSGEPMAEFLAREAEVQAQTYKNMYERDLEALKNWTDAFSSIIVSVALIVIIQLVSAMIYSMDSGMIAGLVTVAVVMGFFGAWIISRAAPHEVMTVTTGVGSLEQRRTRQLAAILILRRRWRSGLARPGCIVAGPAVVAALPPVGIVSDQRSAGDQKDVSSAPLHRGGHLGRLDPETGPTD